MDESLRKLEREFQQSGDIESEARLLGKKLQLGLLIPEQIEIASYLEYPAAQKIIHSQATICGILELEQSPDRIAQLWASNFQLFFDAVIISDVLCAAELSAAKIVVERCGEREDAGGAVLELLQYYLSAAAKGYANSESPMTYGYDGGTLQEMAAQYMRRELHFAIYCIYNLCESLDSYLLGMHDQTRSHAKMVFYDALEFFPYEREMLCQRIGRELVPWLLSEWPPTPRRFVELNFDIELE